MAWIPPVRSVMAAPKLVPRSQLAYQNNFQHKFLSDKEESLKDHYAQKSQSYLCALSPESSQYSSGYGGFCSNGLQGKYLTSQAKTLPPISVARRKEGVDRAYPLKPVLNYRNVSGPVVNTAQLRSSPCMEKAPNSRLNSMREGKLPAGRFPLATVFSPWAEEPKQSASHLYRSRQAYILKLEEDGRKMEQEIRKQEAILREKLSRTKEELRRIQREKELAKAEERRRREAERTHEERAARHPEEKTFRVAVRPGDRVFGGVQSAEATVPKPGTALRPQELAMRKLKKEQLVASNSRIRDHVPQELSGSSSELATEGRSCPATRLVQGSGDQLFAEAPYMQAASNAVQEDLGECSFCGRRFVLGRLEKHMGICSKIQRSERKVFDSSKARARGTELEQFQQWNSSERPQKQPPRRNNWRQKHDYLMQTLQQARQVQQIVSKGGKASALPSLPPIENSDYVACPYCTRRFSPQAAERHIPKCKTIKNRPPPPPWRKRC
ncbi:zinc finger C2HC domain-containing protein 1C [Falco naumanni]|uniref:zinc finger C2HC domain-containing protein 1C n=1 Tax=Falco naumanni TaxID=148594 RepID=UPI001ADE3016|nr:zinc finger C2HC domain-containing protein 1C [Falco naumanni]XP_040458445.1 zinc finger C2HC domain-containing protein 1C [Falco naumanni]